MKILSKRKRNKSKKHPGAKHNTRKGDDEAFFTKPSAVEICFEALFKHVHVNHETIFLEPCVNFLILLQTLNNTRPQIFHSVRLKVRLWFRVVLLFFANSLLKFLKTILLKNSTLNVCCNTLIKEGTEIFYDVDFWRCLFQKTTNMYKLDWHFFVNLGN